MQPGHRATHGQPFKGNIAASDKKQVKSEGSRLKTAGKDPQTSVRMDSRAAHGRMDAWMVEEGRECNEGALGVHRWTYLRYIHTTIPTYLVGTAEGAKGVQCNW